MAITLGEDATSPLRISAWVLSPAGEKERDGHCATSTGQASPEVTLQQPCFRIPPPL